MKKNILIIVLVFSFNISIGQNFYQIEKYEFETVESYRTEIGKVLICANYLFNNPANKDEINRLISIEYILKWMTGTPDYTFDIGSDEMELTKGNTDLFGLYMVAMAKVVIENKDKKLDNDEIHSRAEKIIINYCSNSHNKMKPSKKIKRILKGRK